MYSHVSLVWVGGHGGLSLLFWPSGTQELLNSFPATLLASSNIVSDCFVHYQGVKASSVGQFGRANGSRVDWLLLFKKMTNIFRQCLLGEQFSRRRQNTRQSNQSDCSMDLRQMHHHHGYFGFPAKIETPPTIGRDSHSTTISPTH